MLLTGVNSISNLFAMLITRYGFHLKSTWVMGGNSPHPASMQLSSIQQPGFQYELPPSCEPIKELPQAEDPVIVRLRGLLEEF